MTDAKRAKNCERCKARKIEEKYMGRLFDFHNCPFVCLKNEIDNVGSGIIRSGKSRIILAD